MNVKMALMLLVASVNVASAEEVKPFGIEAGGDPARFSFSPDSFSASAIARNPHPDFENYDINSTPETGVCLVRASTFSFDPENEKAEVDHLFQVYLKVSDQLTSKYGAGEIQQHGSPDDLNTWLQELASGRRHQTVWRPVAPYFGIGIQDIALAFVVSKNLTTPGVLRPRLILQYTFTNYDECFQIFEESQKAPAGPPDDGSQL